MVQYVDARQENALNFCATGASTGLDRVDIKLKKQKLHKQTKRKYRQFVWSWSVCRLSAQSETNIRVRENNYEKIQI